MSSGAVCECGWDKTQLSEKCSFICAARNGQWKAHWACPGCLSKYGERCKTHTHARVVFTGSLWADSTLIASIPPWRPWLPGVAYIAGNISYDDVRARPHNIRTAIAVSAISKATPLGSFAELITGDMQNPMFGGDGILINTVVILGDYSRSNRIEVTPKLFLPASSALHTIILSIPEFFFEVSQPIPREQREIIEMLTFPQASWQVDPHNRRESTWRLPSTPKPPSSMPWRFTMRISVAPSAHV